MENEIFISYSSLDEERAFEVLDYIENGGYDCFIAKRDIKGGNHYAKDLVKAMNDCKVVVLIASSNSNRSEHVMNEMDICFDKHKTIIPLFIEDFDICDEFRYYIGRSQRIIVNEGELIEALPRLLDSIKREYPPTDARSANADVGSEDDTDLKHVKTVFEYDPSRGIMINPEDRMRNVSFRQDTFLHMMNNIYQAIESLSGPEAAKTVFYKCGYEGGSNFGARLNQMYERENKTLSEKLNKWCEFDSQVGWGKFVSCIDLNEDEGSLSGTLTINECFFVDKKNNQHVCAYINGYCAGVIEALLGNIDIELSCTTCPIVNKFKSECVFEVRMKDEA